MNKKVSIFVLSAMTLSSIATSDVMATRNNKRVAARKVIAKTNNAGNIVSGGTLVNNPGTTTGSSNNNGGVKAVCGAGTYLNAATSACEICDPTQKPDHASWIADATKPNQCAWECDKNDGYKLNDEDGGKTCINAKEQREVSAAYSSALSEATNACTGIKDSLFPVNVLLFGSDLLSGYATYEAARAEWNAWQARESVKVDMNIAEKELSNDQLRELVAKAALDSMKKKYDPENKGLVEAGGDTEYTENSILNDGADPKAFQIKGDTAKQYEVSFDTDKESYMQIKVAGVALEGSKYVGVFKEENWSVVSNGASLQDYKDKATDAKSRFTKSMIASGVSALGTGVAALKYVDDARDDMKRCNEKVANLRVALNNVATVYNVDVKDLSAEYNTAKNIISDCGDFDTEDMHNVQQLLTASTITSTVATGASLVARVGAGKMAETSSVPTKETKKGEKMALIGGAIATGANASSTVTTTYAIFAKYWDQYKKARECKNAL